MKLLTLARDLKRRKAREKQRLFIAEGVRAVEELLRSGVKVVGVLVAPQLKDAPRGAALIDSIATNGATVEEVGSKEFASAAETESPQGVLAIAEVPGLSLEKTVTGQRFRLLVLDGVQDPGNVGTIIRTAAGMGFSGTAALPGTVDFWNPKVVRAAMGASFHHHLFQVTLEELSSFLASSGCRLWGADSAGEPLDMLLPPPDRLALAVGNEGAGLSEELLRRVDKLAALPISPAVESLNVAVATGIMLYQLRSI